MQTILTVTLFVTIFTSVHKSVGEMDALNVHETAVLALAGLLAYGAFIQLGLSVVGGILVKHII